MLDAMVIHVDDDVWLRDSMLGPSQFTALLPDLNDVNLRAAVDWAVMAGLFSDYGFRRSERQLVVSAYHGKPDINYDCFDDAADVLGGMSTLHGLAHLVLEEKAAYFFRNATAREFVERDLPKSARANVSGSRPAARRDFGEDKRRAALSGRVTLARRAALSDRVTLASCLHDFKTRYAKSSKTRADSHDPCEHAA